MATVSEGVLVYSLPEYFKRIDVSAGLWSRQMDKPSWIDVRKPITKDRKIHDHFIANQRVHAGGSFVYSLPECTISGRGGLIDVAGSLVSTGRALPPEPIDVERFSKTLSRRKDIRQVSGTVALLSGRWSNNYFHWMLEVFQKLRLLKEFSEEIDHYYLVCETPFQNESLHTYSGTGILRDKDIINIQACPIIRVERLIVPEQGGIPGVTRKEAISFLRDVFLPQASQGSGIDRIYISRGASRRHVINEDQLTEFLEKYQFRKVVLEELSLQEQVALFANASVVLAPHGAGLTNLVFCNEGTKVIELFAPEFVSGVYWLICHQVDLEYYYVIGDSHAPPSTIEKDNDLSTNIQIDIDKIRSVLKIAEVI